MTAEALGVSVAPSFFHTCVSEGKIAKPEEVQKFKVRFFEFLNKNWDSATVCHDFLSDLAFYFDF